MAWPKNTKASTANVDAGTDLISNARGDIKQNIDNVNDIIDTFDIGGDSSGQIQDGDLLKYVASSNSFVPIAQTAIASTRAFGIFRLTGAGAGNIEQVDGSAIYRKAISTTTNVVDTVFTELSDSTGDFIVQLAAGTYLVYPEPGRTVGDTPSALDLHNEDTDSLILDNFFQGNEVGTTNEVLIQGFATFTLASNTNVSFRVTGSSQNMSAAYAGIFEKIA